jgi:putative ABC transport system permease protein
MNPWIRRFFTLTLLAYPSDFREQYRTSMYDHFEAEGGGWGRALRTMADVVATALTMRVENLWRDIVYATRMNVKAPLFTVVIVGAIALAIATNTVVFALLNAVLLKPLPYANPQQIGQLWQTTANAEIFTALSTDQVQAIARASKSFSSVTGVVSQDSLSSPYGSLKRLAVLPNYFTTLGIRPLVGRFFTAGSSDREAIISYSLWRDRYGGSAQALGQTLTLDRKGYTIVGVAPKDMLDLMFGNVTQSDVWTPLPHARSANLLYAVFPIVRLKDGVSWEAAQADISRIVHNIKGKGAPEPQSTYRTGPLGDSIFASARAFLWMVFAAVTGVLLIACANVANLLLVRGAVREGEFAVRSAIGASSRRIASQVFVEAFLLAAVGAAIGLAAAWLALPWAKANVPGNFPRLQTASIDPAVLLYVIGLLVGVTLLTGMIPAYKPRQKRRSDPAARLRSALVIAEVAIAFALTTGFGLLLHSFVTLTSVPLGFSPHGVYAAMAQPSHNVVFYPKVNASAGQTVRNIVRELREIPGVQDAAVSTAIPFQNAFMMTFLLPRRWNGDANMPSMPVSAGQVGQTYFTLMRIPLITGRAFVESDFKKNSSNVLINQAFARKYFPHQIAVGRLVRLSPKEHWRVAGVVGDTRTSLKQLPSPMLYLPYNGGFGPYYGFAIRVSKPVPNLAAQVSAILRRAQPDAGDVSFKSLDDYVAADAAGVRTSLELLGALAAVALLLGLCGIYSVVSYGTERRFHEIGIRVAVGARPQNILSLIVSNALLQGTIGVGAGIVLCAFTTRLLSSELYKTSPLDPATLVGVVAVMIGCTAIAALIPACRAALARPASTLRYE